MLKQYVLYTQTTPFLGYIKHFGRVDIAEAPDGSTMYECLQRALSHDSDLRLYVFPAEVQLTDATRETGKFDPVSSTIVNQGAGDITPAEQAAAIEAAKASIIAQNLPSWTAVSNAVDGIGSLADAKVYLKKLSRVVYWLAKNSEV